MTPAEQRFIELLQADMFSIDAEGAIWRHKEFHPRNGTMIEVAPRRAEHEAFHGYLCVHVAVDGNVRKVMAHRVVWLAFHGEIDDDLEVNHLDGIKKHNAPDNLELVTHSDNMKHAAANGWVQMFSGEDHPNAVLTIQKVRRIREILASGVLASAEIARMFGVASSTIQKIKDGRTWANVD